jgi:hypothetical protein
MEYALTSEPSGSSVFEDIVVRLPSVRKLRARRHRPTSVPMGSETATSGFDALADIWERETRNSSDFAATINHWAYRAIVAQGPGMVPQILERLRTRGGFWFPALEELAGWNPIMPDEWGDMRKMTEAWFRWVGQSADAQAFRHRGPGYFFPFLSETE